MEGGFIDPTAGALGLAPGDANAGPLFLTELGGFIEDSEPVGKGIGRLEKIGPV